MKKAIYTIAFVFCICDLYGQMTVDASLSPEVLINDVLLGNGVNAQNITVNHNNGSIVSPQLGYFEASQSNIGLSRGIILATGKVNVAVGPNDIPTAYIPLDQGTELMEESDLNQLISTGELFDVGLIEFDFTAKGDTLRFKYVFASEEYNEHTCSPYNDVFGFFISGPGIQGNPNFENNARNVALVPGTNVPVAINTVNQGFAGEFGSNNVCNAVSSNWQANSVYYVDNASNTSFSATQFDGFTVPIEVKIPVICGETYHIKLAIADAVDERNDSAVFIEAGSFSSEPPLTVSYELENTNGAGEGVEGCSSLKIKLERNDSTNVKRVYIRNNLNSQVLEALPDSVTFYPMQGAITLNVPLENDANYEGLRNALIEVLQPEVCSQDTAVIPINFSILDHPALTVSAPDTLVLDCEEAAEISLLVSGGYPPYSIEWSEPSLTGFDIILNPDQEITANAIITDFCDLNSSTVSVFAYRDTYEDIEIVLPEEIYFNCVDPINLSPALSGGYGDYSYSWQYNGEEVSDEEVLNITLSEPGLIQLTVLDKCVPDAFDSVNAISISNPIFVDIGPDRMGKCDEELNFIPEVSGGFGNLSYQWQVNGINRSIGSSFSFTPDQTALIVATVTDECNQSNSDSLFVFLNNPELTISMVTDTVICESERLEILPLVQGGYGDYTMWWNGVQSTNGILSIIPERSSTHTFKVEDICGKEATSTISVNIKTIKAFFEFNEEDNREPITNLSVGADVYSWNFPDGSFSNDRRPLIDFETISGGSTFLFVSDSIGCSDEYRNTFLPAPLVFLPTAFTPDGDGLNDVFKAEAVHIVEFELQIFDRWGNQVFYSNDINKGWNGESADDSKHAGESNQYSYRYTAKSFNDQIKEGIGTVILIR